MMVNPLTKGRLVKYHTDREDDLYFFNKKMAATSKHYLDILLWVKSVIKSIDHPLQDASAKKLIRNYFKMYGHKFKSNEISEIKRDLIMELDVVQYKRKQKLNNE